MAERLTEIDYSAWHYNCGYQNKKDSLERTKREHKLGMFEDIMEKYGIEDFEQLNIMLFCLSSESKFQLKQLQKLYKKYGIKDVKELGKKLADGITWQKACELACKRICYMLDQEMQYHKHEKFNSEEYLKTEIDFFYQQAKTEGNDE